MIVLSWESRNAQAAQISCADVMLHMGITLMGNSICSDESELHRQFRDSVMSLSDVISILRNSVANYYQFACFESLLNPTEATHRKRQILTELHINLCMSLRMMAKCLSEAEIHISQIRLSQEFPETG